MPHSAAHTHDFSPIREGWLINKEFWDNNDLERIALASVVKMRSRARPLMQHASRVFSLARFHGNELARGHRRWAFVCGFKGSDQLAITRGRMNPQPWHQAGFQISNSKTQSYSGEWEPKDVIKATWGNLCCGASSAEFCVDVEARPFPNMPWRNVCGGAAGKR